MVEHLTSDTGVLVWIPSFPDIHFLCIFSFFQFRTTMKILAKSFSSNFHFILQIKNFLLIINL